MLMCVQKIFEKSSGARMSTLSEILRFKFYRSSRNRTRPMNEGIMSSANESSFIGFQLLYSSIITQCNCLVCLIDQGINIDQRIWCYKQENLLLITPDINVLKFVDERSKWNKPYFMIFSPFQKTLWIDPEIIVLGNLSQLFNMISDNPVFVVTKDKIEKNDLFFSRMPGKVNIPYASVYPTTAVFGLDLHRDLSIVYDWILAIENATANPKLESTTRRLDSAALAWSLAKHNSVNVNINMISSVWNWSAQNGVNGRAPTEYDNAFHLISKVKEDFPNVNLLNWGWPTPWMTWEDYLIDINPHRAIIYPHRAIG